MSKNTEKTLEWSTVFDFSIKLTKSENPRGNPRGNPERKPGEKPDHFLTFYQKHGPRQGGGPLFLSGVKGRPGTPRGSESTLGGVETFLLSLCAGTLCGGFVGHIPPVSWLEEVYSGWEERSPSSRRGFSSSTTRE